MTATATDANGNTSEFSAGLFVSVEEPAEADIPLTFFMKQNFPNPFNPETTIRFGVKESCRVVLKVYNVIGREVTTLVDRDYQPGVYNVVFEAAGLASGIYLYEIRMKAFQSVRKMIILE